MTRLLTLATALALATGCIYVDGNDDGRWDAQPPASAFNTAPWILTADAACYYDDFNADDILWFETTVDDADGLFDVVSVWADVYDDRSGELVQSFELYPTDDPAIWFSDWLVSTTWIDCWYDWYTVDFVAYDAADAWGATTIRPDTY